MLMTKDDSSLEFNVLGYFSFVIMSCWFIYRLKALAFHKNENRGCELSNMNTMNLSLRTKIIYIQSLLPDRQIDRITLWFMPSVRLLYITYAFWLLTESEWSSVSVYLFLDALESMKRKHTGGRVTVLRLDHTHIIWKRQRCWRETA